MRERARSPQDRAFVRELVRSDHRLVSGVIKRMNKDWTPSVSDFLRTLYSDHMYIFALVLDNPGVVRFETLLGLATSVRV